MKAQDYAVEVERLLRRALPAPPPEAVELVQKAKNLDTLLGGPAGPALEAAKQQLRTALTGLADEIEDAIADAVPIPAIADLLKDADLTGPKTLDLSATLGPLHVEAHSPSVTIVDPHDGTFLALGPLPPNVFVAALDAGPVKGGGTVIRLPDGLAGVLTADLGFAQAAALASLREVSGEPSFLAVLSAGFTPGIQLGFGFQSAASAAWSGSTGPCRPRAVAPHRRRQRGQGVVPARHRQGQRSNPPGRRGPVPPSVGSIVAGRRSVSPGSRWPARASPRPTSGCSSSCPARGGSRSSAW